MLWAEEFEQFNESFIVAGIEVVLIIPDIKPCISNLVQDFGDEVSSYLLVEEISLF